MRSDLNYLAVKVLNLTRIEFYRMNPGIFSDMVYRHNKNFQRATNNATV